MENEKKKYHPVLTLRPSEMMGLEKLPGKDKDLILPAFQIRPWLSSKSLSASVKQIEAAFGTTRAWIGNLDKFYEPKNTEQTATDDAGSARDEFLKLLDSQNGYQNWCNYARDNEKMIPTLQMGDVSQFEKQIETLAALRRGLVLHLKHTELGKITDNMMSLIKESSDSNEIHLILDYEKIAPNDNLSELALRVDNVLNEFVRETNCKFVAISSTSFPDSFAGLSEQEIKERRLFSEFKNRYPEINLIYSDHGSARIPEKGKPMLIRTRLDLPGNNIWTFFRSREVHQKGDAYLSDYCKLAETVLKSEKWRAEFAKLKIWGVNQIKDTSQSSHATITSPARATAVRINLHLHRQIHYGDDAGYYDTAEPFVD